MPTIGTSKAVQLSQPTEGSRLNTGHEKSDVRQRWKDVVKQTDQTQSDRQLLNALTRKVEMMRRRMLGGGSTQGTTLLSIRGEYDPTATYNPADLVVISTGLNQGTFVAVQIVSGISPTVGAPNWLQFPAPLLGQWL